VLIVRSKGRPLTWQPSHPSHAFNIAANGSGRRRRNQVHLDAVQIYFDLFPRVPGILPGSDAQ